MNINITGAIVVYVIIWWLVFFPILSQDVRGVWEDEGEHAEGVEQGAPTDPQIWAKVRRASIITTPIWAVVMAVIFSGVIDFRG